MNEIRTQVRFRLQHLISGRMSREEVVRWAIPLVEADDLDVDIYDPQAWDAILALSRADSQSSPGDYLYDENDFQRWLNEVDE